MRLGRVASAAAGDVGGSVSANHPLPHIAVITAAQLNAGWWVAAGRSRNPLGILTWKETVITHGRGQLIAPSHHLGGK